MKKRIVKIKGDNRLYMVMDKYYINSGTNYLLNEVEKIDDMGNRNQYILKLGKDKLTSVHPTAIAEIIG